jgi:chromosome segregation ATPase
MKRTDEAEEKFETRGADSAAYAETIRNIHDSSSQPRTRGEDDKVSLFWRVFGGTILSIVALVAITVFNSISSSIAELRSEVARLNEAKADAAKKDDVSTLRTQVSLLTGYRAEIDSLKERASKYRAEIEEAKKDTQSKLELAKKDHEAELKLFKDELLKVRQDVDKNQAADNERRDQRTAQMKVVDETLKEIQKNLFESREKIARLEGQQVQSKSVQPARATEPADRQ